ncbi:DUF1376 domain-containing protein [Bartonella sp. A05]|uniref:DUF1376 domain-containing protein n=1 Tax=Bartonella sp. A05 TaxID=2967261 RepID=UPI0022A8E8A9|nr:DUF1376 domain-containing protein [Bartonella sp. A05]MCZ2204015.1 YdaU family protein [Bartonella sp. A05]
MSNTLPWIRFFPSKWLLATNGMTGTQKGVYFTLVCLMYENGKPIENDSEILARICGYSLKTFKNTIEFLIRKKKILLSENFLWNEKVSEEIINASDKANEISQKRSEAAKARWEKQSKSNTCTTESDANVEICNASTMQMQCKNMHINNNSNNISPLTTIVVSPPLTDARGDNAHKERSSSKQYEPEVVLPSHTEQQQVSQNCALQNGSKAYEKIASEPDCKSIFSKTKPVKKARTDRGHRLPADFEPNLQYAIDQGLTHDEALFECERFKNFWLAKSGKDATKTNWQRTWYNWVTSQYGTLAKKKERLEKEKRYGKSIIENTEQQRGRAYRIAQYMSDIKNSDSPYRFLFEDDESTSIPLANGQKTIPCRSGENYLVGQ